MIRFSTAGESHGEALIALISGLPAGVPVDLEFVNRELWRRQQGYGRGGRMKIETDKAHILSGVRHGKTIGSPIAIELVNRDWKNWEEKLPVEAGDPAKHQAVASPRPGHADLAGALKYNFPDARYVLERASARESAARVAAGAMAKLMLRALGIEVASHVIRVGRVELDRTATWEEIAPLAAQMKLSSAAWMPLTEARMKEEVEEVSRTGDTVGGVFEVVVHGVPAGLGTYANWDEKLDGLLAWSVMSIQAVKAVEIGRGVMAAESFGSQVHDPIHYAAEPNGAHPLHPPAKQRRRHRGRGLERRRYCGARLSEAHLHPSPAARVGPLRHPRGHQRKLRALGYLRRPGRRRGGRSHGRPHLAGLAQQKFGGDSVAEMQRNFLGYIEQIRSF